MDLLGRGKHLMDVGDVGAPIPDNNSVGHTVCSVLDFTILSIVDQEERRRASACQLLQQ
jgi:hypothetical protein